MDLILSYAILIGFSVFAIGFTYWYVCMYVCIYVCMVITYSRVWINRARLPILLVVS